MKKIFLPCLFAILLSLSSCSWVHNIQIDTLRPAQVSYHIPTPGIVVLSNCTIDSDNNNSRYIDENGKEYKLIIPSDSLPQEMAMSLATNLYDSRAFTHVEVLLLDSSDITGTAPIDQAMLHEWQSYAPNDVHIAINAITPTVNMQVIPLEDMFCAELSITTQAIMQCFIPDMEVSDMTVCDTLYWQTYGETPTIACSHMPEFEACLEEAITSLSVRASNLLAPHQCIVNRTIFVTGHPAMKDAYEYWESGLYTEASYIWEYVYKHAQDKGRKAKAAANLALYHEIEEELTQALKYAQAAEQIFEELKSTTELQYAISYRRDLEQRIKEAAILDKTLLQ